MDKKRIVVKIGSSSLTNSKGEIDHKKLHDHILAIAALKKLGHEVLLVTSGAVAAGFRMLGYPSRPVTLKGKQAAAAVGQNLLIQKYSELFSQYDIRTAQILLTRTDFSKKERYHNAFATFTELLERSILPIINENDTVSVAELTFGDNDMLSALVSGLVHADQLIILTDINGFYTDNPLKNPDAKRIDYLTEVSDDMLEHASGTGSKIGTGGMQSKLLAARTALKSGVHVFIGKGQGENKLVEILEGRGDGTYIGQVQNTTLPNQKQWLSFTEVSGKIYIDEGAKNAILSSGKSLLPAGVYKIEGRFHKGDVVEVYSESGLLGRGEVLYSSDDLRFAMGKRTDELPSGSMEVIHRNQWVQTI
ncbi:glutamate 5-kinase [Lysinibacillus composti]|uniref:Glutamate 5-kinase n=1 Tax=Lysinibacillus composti TaxID=720633 RepID=A0A3N9UJF9_9BACI|nr:glutamate 5-kinase [Lysinibacillus composti]MBM7607319.1 glutamate 5-kinase [Lysinibacillus composti]RQW76110.1 glutamate 5-kinase [Lysinibacillus composti]